METQSAAVTYNESALMSNSILVELNCRAWSFRKFDKDISDELTTSKKAKTGALRVNKRMLLSEHTKPIEKAFSEIRQFFYSQTLPFYDKGARLICIDNYMSFCKAMNERVIGVDALLRTFYDNYPNYIREARNTLLGDTFSIEEYPPIESIKSRFEIKLNFSPVPDGTTLDKLAGMPPAELQKIKDDLIQKERERTAGAMNDLWRRLYEAVSKMHERLSDEKNVFHSSLVGNLCDLVEILPRMNITKDPKLDRMGREIEKALCSHDPKTLRTNMDVRKAAAGEAKRLADAMSAFF